MDAQNGWFVAASLRSLGKGLLARKVCGLPIVLFRGANGAPAALLDRCPHRNVPLSKGVVADGTVQCAYHGWTFDHGGRCLRVPGLVQQEALPRSYDAQQFAAREHGGWIWVYLPKGSEPLPPLPALLELKGPGVTTVCEIQDAPAELLPTLENALDVPHTAFLHRGLFRGTGARQHIRAVLTRTEQDVTVQYLGERRPPGLAGRILSPSGGEIAHQDRFVLPSIAQVEYAIGEETRFLVTAACTPLQAGRTRLHTTLQFRTRLPGWLVRAALRPVALRIFRQDVAILRLQHQAHRTFGGAEQVSSPLDLMGAQIARLLAMAREGRRAPPDDPPFRREVEMWV